MQIQSFWNLTDTLETIVTEVRTFLKIDRLAICQRLPIADQFIVESVTPGQISLLDLQIVPPEISSEMLQQYQQGQISVVKDVNPQSALIACSPFVEATQTRAYLLVPILVNEKFWGLLCAHQCSQAYDWQPFEIALLQQLAKQIAIAVQQANLYQEMQYLNSTLEQQVQERTAQLQQALNFESMLKRITDKVRDSLDEGQILRTAVEELAEVLDVGCCDTALYDLERETSTIYYEAARTMPAYHQVTWSMNHHREVYNQLLAGECFQFCYNPHPLRGRVTVLTCPLVDAQRVFGDLWLFRETHHAFNDLEVRLVQQVANQCAIAIRQARLYQTAQAQVAELEKLNRLKDDFLSTVSHELRTPISNMKMAIYMLKQAAADERRRERYLEILQTECARETELINDLLDLQRLEGASYPVFLLEAITIQDWLPQILTPFYSRIQEHQQQLEAQVPADLPPLISDRASLERILAELLNNACKYTPAQGRISLRVYFAAQIVPLPPSHNGPSLSPGPREEPVTAEAIATPYTIPTNPCTTFVISNEMEIPATELPRIFDKFYRIPHADPWKQGGTGLGLALVHRLVERLKGEIHVRSTEGWTTFTLHLPTQPRSDFSSISPEES